MAEQSGASFPEPLYDSEVAKTHNPIERAAFDFFYRATKKEGLDVLPNYSWDQFHEGIAPFNDMPISFVDDFVLDTGLIPNYNRETTDENHLSATPMLDALRGPFIQAMHRSRQTSAVRVMGIHPSLASPLLFARSITAAYQAEFSEDIRPNIYVVYGAYPLTMQYRFNIPKTGKEVLASPIDIGRSMANLVLTAPKTASTDTNDGDVQAWLDATRATFKLRNREILSKPGNILIAHPSGRRGLRSAAKVPPYHHREYLPDGSLRYITDVGVPTFIVGIDDQILTDPSHPSSIVNIVGHPYPRHLTSDKAVTRALRLSATLASSEKDIYVVEGKADRAIRLGYQLVTRSSHSPSVE